MNSFQDSDITKPIHNMLANLQSPHSWHYEQSGSWDSDSQQTQTHETLSVQIEATDMLITKGSETDCAIIANIQGHVGSIHPRLLHHTTITANEAQTRGLFGSHPTGRIESYTVTIDATKAPQAFVENVKAHQAEREAESTKAIPNTDIEAPVAEPAFAYAEIDPNEDQGRY